jgi:hypothetical protein
MTCLDIVKEYLVDNGFDGLWNEAGECGCTVKGLDPGPCMQAECRAGYMELMCVDGDVFECIGPHLRPDGAEQKQGRNHG